MILKPLQNGTNEVDDPIAQALKIAGLSKTEVAQPEKDEDIQKRVRKVLDVAGASIEDAARALAGAMEKDETRLPAAKIAFELHGALKDRNKAEIPAISIVINGTDHTKNQSLLTFLTPREITQDGNAA